MSSKTKVPDPNREVGFAIPGSHVPVEFGPYAVAAPIVVIVFGIVGAYSQSTIFIALALIAGGVWFAYWFLTGYKIIRLSPRGMRGLGRHGQEIKLDWGVPIVIEDDIYADLPAFAISDAERPRKTLVFPRVITLLPEFQDALQRFAPPGHALVAAVDALQAAISQKAD